MAGMMMNGLHGVAPATDVHAMHAPIAARKLEDVIEDLDVSWFADVAHQHVNGGAQCPVHHAPLPLLIQRPSECQTQQQWKKRRCQWTPELHSVFEDAVRAVGPRPTPSTVHAAMNVPSLNLDFDLTVGMVKSHLQKYKLDCLCNQAASKPVLVDPELCRKLRTEQAEPKASPPGVVPQGSGNSPASATIPTAPTGTTSEAIIVTIVDAPLAVGLLVRTFTGYEVTYQYEPDYNTVVLIAEPPTAIFGKTDVRSFGLGSLPLLQDGVVVDSTDELQRAHVRRLVLPCRPRLEDSAQWTAQVVATGHGDRTVCIQIEKIGDVTTNGPPGAGKIVC